MPAGQQVASGQHVRLTLTDSSAKVRVVDSVSQDQVWLRSPAQSDLLRAESEPAVRRFELKATKEGDYVR